MTTFLEKTPAPPMPDPVPASSHKKLKKTLLTILIAGIVAFSAGRFFLQSSGGTALPPGGVYAWQKSCDAKCGETVGGTFMSQIDASDCGTLKVGILMMQSAQGIDDVGGPGPDSSSNNERLMALNDKSSSLHCP